MPQGEKNKLQHEMCKIENNNIIEINEDFNDATNNDDIIHYWHEIFKLTKRR